ncbi:MAG: ribosome small subunit-dependent GTPase A [Anaerolineae bacterium]
MAEVVGSGTGRVLRAQSGFYDVSRGDGTIRAVLRGILKKDRQETGLVALGDIVRYDVLALPEGDSGQVEAVITGIEPRASSLSRRAPGPKGVWAQDVVVANVDQLIVVFAVQHPAPSPRMLDRFLAVAEIDEIDSVIVFNKTDLGVPDDVGEAIERYRAIGYQVLLTSAEHGSGVQDLRELLAARTSAVVGPSGVGKSRLLNEIEPGLGLKVGAVSDSVAKGRHTTRVGELHRLSSGGLVADTPGLREIGVWEVDPGELEWAFVEFRPHINSCRYYDCTHVHEPGCAVCAAVEDGQISSERHDSYVRLLEDEG